MSQPELQSQQSSLRRRFSLRKPFRIISDKKKSILIKKDEKKKQKRDVEKSITLDEVYLIIYLFSIEISKRGLTEPGIFNPVRLGDMNYEARYLVNCLLRDNRKEYEDELKVQTIHNFAVGIRIVLRNCPTNLVSYKYYEEFVKYEQEWDYDPKSESFTKFLSYLPQKNQRILVELFDLFALIMKNSHVNLMQPTRILRSMSLHIFNESKTKTFENFRQAYQSWLKYSNALIHLFLSYIRERAYTTGLSDRLKLLLTDYVECRQRCLMNSRVSEDGNDVIFSEHVLPDITIADLDEAIASRRFSNSNRKSINKLTRRSSIFEHSPEIKESLSSSQCKEILEYYSHIFDDPRNPEKKWEKLQNKGLNILSEEALILFLNHNDKRMNLNRISSEEQISSVCSDNSATIYDNELMDDVSKLFSHTSTFGPNYSDFCGENLTRKKLNTTDTTLNEKRKPKQKIRKFKLSMFLCFKRRPRSVKSVHVHEPESTHLDIETIDALFPYALVEIIKERKGENLDEWILIEPRRDLQVHESEWIIIEDKNQFFSNQKKVLNDTTFNSNGKDLTLTYSQFNRDDNIKQIIDQDYEPQHRSQIHSEPQIQRQNSRLLYEHNKVPFRDDYFMYNNYSSVEKQYRRSSINSSIYRNIVRGKDLPFPITSQRINSRQVSRSQSPLSDIEVIPVNAQYSPQPQQYQNSHESYQRQTRQYSQQYLQLWDTQTTTIQIQNSRKMQVPKVTTQYVSTAHDGLTESDQQSQRQQERQSQEGQEGQKGQGGQEDGLIQELMALYPLLVNPLLVNYI